VEKALEIAKEMGAKRAMLLAVSAPFHCSMLKPAGDKLAAELERVTLGDMQIPVVTNVTAEYIIDKDKVKEELISIGLYISSWVYAAPALIFPFVIGALHYDSKIFKKLMLIKIPALIVMSLFVLLVQRNIYAG